MEMSAGMILRIVASLGLVLLIIVSLARVLQRKGMSGQSGWMRVLSSEPLGAGTELHLVQILDRYYVLSSGGGQVRLVTPVDGPVPGLEGKVEASTNAEDGSFRTKALGQFMALDRLRQKGSSR